MHESIKLTRNIFENLFLAYAICLMASYFVLSVISAVMLRKYMKKQSYTDYNQIISSPFAPGISVIAPAFNESVSIVENIRALVSLYYHDFEVIIVNDGSTDDTIEKVVQAYDLEKVNFAVPNYLSCKPIRGIYKSKSKSFSNLLLIDKENGGKSDALNAGINISTKDFFVAVDVDSIIASDALMRLSKHFLDEKREKVIAVGGNIQIANSCIIRDGQVVEVKVPRNFLARFQVLEYARAFLLGRIAWSKLNGLLIISGALGLFDKKVAIDCGGYYTKTVGEDMELIVRMRRYMVDRKIPYRVISIPDPLLWTEVPTSLKTLGRQRTRWTRGTIETLDRHKAIFFNPRFKAVGMLGYPHYFFFEWPAPIIEFLGLLYFGLIALMGQPHWDFFLVLLAFVYGFALLFSLTSLFFEQATFHRYPKIGQMFGLIFNAMIEPIVFHPLTVWWGLRGNYEYFIAQKSGWGQMKRVGFSKAKTGTAT